MLVRLELSRVLRCQGTLISSQEVRDSLRSRRRILILDVNLLGLNDLFLAFLNETCVWLELELELADASVRFPLLLQNAFHGDDAAFR